MGRNRRKLASVVVVRAEEERSRYMTICYCTAACKMLASSEGEQGCQNHTKENMGRDEVICKRSQSLVTRAADNTR